MLALFFFLLPLPIQMTLLSPNIYYFIFKTFLTAMNIAGYTLRYLEQDFPIERLYSMGCFFIPIISATLIGCYSFFHKIFLIPVYFWNLLWHPNGWSIINMLQNPTGNGQLVTYNKQHHCHCWRERPWPVPRWVWRQKTTSTKILVVYSCSWRKPYHMGLWLKTMSV